MFKSKKQILNFPIRQLCRMNAETDENFDILHNDLLDWEDRGEDWPEYFGQAVKNLLMMRIP